MRTVVLSPEPEFGHTLAAIVESVKGCSCQWQPRFSASLLNQSDVPLVVWHCQGTSVLAQLQSLLRPADPSSRAVKKLLLITDDMEASFEIQAIQMGVFDCLRRPVNLQRFRYLIDSIRVRWTQALRTAPASTANTIEPQLKPLDQLGLQIGRLADSDVSLLLTGETGVGKTFLARQIHNQSKRRNRPFVTIHCGAIPDSLIESELFGHVKGAFTGADDDRIGKLAYAADGTVFFDELDTLPIGSQAKLLHAVEDREFHPVGGNKANVLKARIISATNARLDDLIQQGKFRSDLLFRLNSYEMHVPALRDRAADIERFGNYFAREYANRNRCDEPKISAEVLMLLRRYAWPGNMRELRNCIERAAIHAATSTITIADLPRKIVEAVEARPQSATAHDGFIGDKFEVDPASPLPASENRWRVEVSQVLDALLQNNNNRTKAANQLGISRAALYKRLTRYNLA